MDRFNADPLKALGWIRAQHADLVSLQELTPPVAIRLAEVLPEYSTALSRDGKLGNFQRGYGLQAA